MVKKKSTAKKTAPVAEKKVQETKTALKEVEIVSEAKDVQEEEVEETTEIEAKAHYAAPAEVVEGHAKEDLTSALKSVDAKESNTDMFDKKSEENSGKTTATRSLLDEINAAERKDSDRPNDFLVTNIRKDRTLVVTDIFLEDGDVRTPLSWEPGECKNLTKLGFTMRDMVKSLKFRNFASSQPPMLVEGKLDPSQLIDGSYFTSDPRGIHDLPKMDGMNTALSVKRNNYYVQELFKRVSLEEERNNRVGSPNEYKKMKEEIEGLGE